MKVCPTNALHPTLLEAGLEGIVGGLNINQTDYNNDGYIDVLVLRGGWIPDGHPNSLLRNNGDGTFEDVTEAAGLLWPLYPTQTACWADFDNDGWLDLFIGNESLRTSNPSQLFHNNQDGTFSVWDRAGRIIEGEYTRIEAHRQAAAAAAYREQERDETRARVDEWA